MDNSEIERLLDADNPGPRTVAQRLLLQAVTRAVGDTGSVSLSVSQNRHMDEERPDWTLRITTTVDGAAVSIEAEGTSLLMLLQDAGNVLAELGVPLRVGAESDLTD
jgi:hypothetical protein